MNNISQAQLAADLGMAQQSIARWETGKFRPNFSTLQKLADYFDIDVDTLLNADIKLSNQRSRSYKKNIDNDNISFRKNLLMKEILELSEHDLSAVEAFLRYLNDKNTF